MKIFFALFLISFTAKASDDYYLDIYDSRSDKDKVEVVFTYKGCVDRLVVTKKTHGKNKNYS